jgi:hypothetical protein
MSCGYYEGQITCQLPRMLDMQTRAPLRLKYGQVDSAAKGSRRQWCLCWHSSCNALSCALPLARRRSAVVSTRWAAVRPQPAPAIPEPSQTNVIAVNSSGSVPPTHALWLHRCRAFHHTPSLLITHQTIPTGLCFLCTKFCYSPSLSRPLYTRATLRAWLSPSPAPRLRIAPFFPNIRPWCRGALPARPPNRCSVPSKLCAGPRTLHQCSVANLVCELGVRQSEFCRQR